MIVRNGEKDAKMVISGNINGAKMILALLLVLDAMMIFIMNV